jgi:hypothetical protein
VKRIILNGLLFILTVSVCFSCEQQTSGTGKTEEVKNIMNTPEEAAAKALEALPQLVTKDNYQGMGFGSLDEVKSATLGRLVRRQVIGYDQLLKFSPGAPSEGLFTTEELQVFPVLVKGAIKTAITVTKAEGGWRISSIGDSAMAEALNEGIIQNGNGSVFSIISVPGLNLDFIGLGNGKEMTLTPVRDYPEIRMIKGKGVKAHEALSAISAFARDFDAKYGEYIKKRKIVR